MASSYVPGSIAKILSAEGGSTESAQPKVKSKLQSLFDKPSTNQFQKAQAVMKDAKSSPTADSSTKPVLPSVTKKRKKVDQGSKILIDREESLRNADEEIKPKKPKRAKKTSQDDAIPEEISDLEKNLNQQNGERKGEQLPNGLKAKRRIEAKKGRFVRVSNADIDGRTAFVGNVALTVDKKMLMKIFKPFGEIESARLRSVAVPNLKLSKKAAAITKSFHPQRHSMNAYVVFKEKQSALDAVKLNGTELEGLHIRVDVAHSKDKHDHKRSIFIGNLSYQTEEESLRNHFGDCGAVENVRIIRDSKTGMGKGFGYIAFQDASSVDLALMLNGEVLEGRSLRIERSTSKPVKTPSTKDNKGRSSSRTSRDRKDLPGSSKKFNKNSKDASESSEKKLKKKKLKLKTDSRESVGASAAYAKLKKKQHKKDIRRKSRERKQRSIGRLLTGAKQAV